MVRENERGRTRSSFAAINGDEIHPAAGSDHLSGKLPPEPLVTDGGLDTYRKTGRVGELLHEVEHTVDIAECRMVRRADAVSSNRNAPDRRNIGRYFCGGQHTAEPRLRALA